MKTMITRGLTLLAMLAASPATAAAHEGHAGNHGFLFGALQPLLSLDHLAAGLFVAGAGTVVVALMARIRAVRKAERDA